jgi:ketosteroid isomerase-like protein
MYHAIVANQVRSIFRSISAGNWQPMVDGLAPDFAYRFYGEHALSGERHTRAAMEEWWQRIFRLLPGGTFTVDEIIVQGPPWNTRVATRMTITASLPGGTAYENVFTQFIHLAWGKVTRVWTLEDTAKLEHALAAVAAAGDPEALAPPITDQPPVLQR